MAHLHAAKSLLARRSLSGLPGTLPPASSRFVGAATLPVQTRLYTSKAETKEKIPPVVKPIKTILVANRGEIALRIFRACTELGIRSAGIYSREDSGQIHRIKADVSFPLDKHKGPVQAYLDIDRIIKLAKEVDVDAIHPGYGFLSERADFAGACAKAGIAFIGPPADVMARMGDKVAARQTAIAAGLPVIPGTDGALTNAKEAKEFCEKNGTPVIFKAAYGGGGRGMRVVTSLDQVEDQFQRAHSEAISAFGNGEIFIERFVQNPRHIEVQVIGDHAGNVVHFFERDCSVQRRHQKVVELAPAPNLPTEIRDKMLRDAIHLCKFVGYSNAGTVEFLYEPATGQHFFMEVNARLQVEHTVTEEITGVDLVHTQIKVAEGKTLPDLGLQQENIQSSGYALQCRLTTEDASNHFAPDFGVIDVFRPAEGFGIRCDSGNAFVGAHVTPYYDSLLVKVIAKAHSLENTILKMRRALKEFRIRGVKTNIPFLLNVVEHPDFTNARTNTRFIDDNPSLFELPPSRNRAQKLITYMANTMVNGPSTTFMTKQLPSEWEVKVPETDPEPDIPHKNTPHPRGLRNVLLEGGPDAFVKAVLEQKDLLVTDTTMRDAHQSLLATRVRTYDLLQIAPYAADNLNSVYSLENWGGATFDVAMRFLHECPWERLQDMRKLIPNIPFQMLLRGANTVGYTSYPDNVLFRFCEMAFKNGMDIFRVFDSLNYLPNILLGMEAARKAGGVVEGTMAYSGDVANKSLTKYTLDYYLGLSNELVAGGAHVLCLKDMAGILTPASATILVDAVKQRHPDVPLHIHTHDTAGFGVASMMACAAAGADVVDVATDSLSGMTSQPSMGALVAAQMGTERPVHGLNAEKLAPYDEYWQATRFKYAPFECTETLKAGNSDVILHQIPGGQYTNLQFQAYYLGQADKFSDIKRAYKEANEILGDIIKVTPSSKVVGDFANWMVKEGLSKEEVLAQADTINPPVSVIEFLQGQIGQPHGGFPEPFRSQVLKDRPRIDIRPGEDLPSCDFDQIKKDLHNEFGRWYITDEHVMSAALYPKVTRDFLHFRDRYGPVDKLDTRTFLVGPTKGKEINLEIEPGKKLDVTCLTVSDELTKMGERELQFLMNGQLRTVKVRDKSIPDPATARPRADKTRLQEVYALNGGDVIEVKVKPGDAVTKETVVAVITSMKMETQLISRMMGKVKAVNVKPGDTVAEGDLVVEIE